MKVEATDDPATTTNMDYTKMKVADLKKELQSRGLDTSGKKTELVARLEGGTGGKKGMLCT